MPASDDTEVTVSQIISVLGYFLKHALLGTCNREQRQCWMKWHDTTRMSVVP